jgi:hypothetical protein
MPDENPFGTAPDDDSDEAAFEGTVERAAANRRAAAHAAAGDGNPRSRPPRDRTQKPSTKA